MAHLAVHALGSCPGCCLSTPGVTPSNVWGPWPAGERLCFLSGNLLYTQVSLPSLSLQPLPEAVSLCFSLALSNSTDITCPSVCPPALGLGSSGSNTTPFHCVCLQSLALLPSPLASVFPPLRCACWTPGGPSPGRSPSCHLGSCPSLSGHPGEELPPEECGIVRLTPCSGRRVQHPLSGLLSTALETEWFLLVPNPPPGCR